MFEDIQAIFGETTVGLFALTFILYLCWWFARDQNKSYLTFCLDIFKSVSQVMAVALFFFVYGLGLLIHDATDLVADMSRGKVCNVPILCTLLSSEEDRRIEVLFKNQDKPTGLWISILSERRYVRGLLERIHQKDGKNVEDFLKCEEKCFPKSDQEYGKTIVEYRKKYVNTIYYDAKNWAYMQPTYYNELEMIQYRSDFARCMSLLAFCYAVLSLIFACFLLPNLFSSNLQKRKSVSSLGRKLIVIAVLFILSYAASEGFQTAERHFNMRTFGYYYSYLRTKEICPKDVEKVQRVGDVLSRVRSSA